MILKTFCGFRRSAVFLAAAIFAAAAARVVAAPAHGVDSTLAFVNGGSPADSVAEAQLREEEEGQDFNSLFDDMDIDTSFAWNNSRINSGRFDYKALGPGDTIRIPLVDSSQNRFFAHPFANYITSPFGPRRYMWHYGADVKLNKGDTVKCMTDGIVRVVQYDRRGYGNVVVVRHQNGLETVYGHLSKVTVAPKHLIRAGETVGLGGNTGRSTGAHLHFEVRYRGEPLNPSYIIDFQNYTLKNDTLVLTRDNFEYLTELRKTLYHSVRKGENLGIIARRYRTTVAKLCRLNGITPKTILSVGRRLVIRSGKEAEKEVVPAVPAVPAVPVQTDAAAPAATTPVATTPAATPETASAPPPEVVVD
jgi:hypothetical protein